MDLEFTVNNQTLKRTDTNKPMDLSNKYLTCKFTFETNEWETLGKFAIFKTIIGNYREAISDGECMVPYDVLKHDLFIITVYGVEDDVRITTNIVRVCLGSSGFVSEYDESSDFNPDMTETVLDLVENKVDKVTGKQLSSNDFTDEYKSTVDNLDTTIATAISEMDIIVVVDELPTSDIKNNKIYFVVNGESIEENLYDVYVRINNKWERLDSIEFNIQDYAKLSDLPVNVSELVNDVPYLTEHQSLSDYYSKSEVDEIIRNMNNGLQLTGDKKIMQTDETLNLTVNLKKDGFPLSNATINIYEVK